MKPSHPKIRQLLRQYQDGLTAKEISERLEKRHDTIYAALQNMPDTYIDRWLKAEQQLPPQAVWCAVVPPENCPKPRPKKSNVRPTQLRRVEPRNLSEIRFGSVLTNASPAGSY
jgi:predicted Zn-ribbon and HTH transcriptional regulator